jgi:murein L,D-transpeptidase YcbB/YkuD
MPLFVLYWAAFVDDQGEVNFRPGVYRWDAQLLAALRDAQRRDER